MRISSLDHRFASVLTLCLCQACSTSESSSNANSPGDGGMDGGDAAAETEPGSSSADTEESSTNETTESSEATTDAAAGSSTSESEDAGTTEVAADAAPSTSASPDSGPSMTDGGEVSTTPDAGCGSLAESAPVTLQNATATYSQTSFGGNPITDAIDGDVSANSGWAIYEGSESDDPSSPNLTSAQSAVFEAVADVGSVGSKLAFTIYQSHTLAGHSIGRFRLSVTGDARTRFADGELSGGDVTANWIVLNPSAVSATNGVELEVLSDDSILASGETPTDTAYIVTATSPLDSITGFRIEVLADESLPDTGPGRYSNGNFVLTEFQVESADCAVAR